MRVTLASGGVGELTVDAIALAVAAGAPLTGRDLELDRLVGGLVSESIDSGEHRGRIHDVLPLPLPAGEPLAARRLLLYGVGALDDLDGQRLRYAHLELVRAARRLGYRRLAVVRSDHLGEEQLTGVVEGCVLGSWERRSRQTAEPTIELEELLLVGFGEGREQELLAAQQNGEATNNAREWQNLPSNELTPEGLARIARGIGERQGLEVEVLGPEEIYAGGYNLLLNVAAGSDLAPRLIRVQHRGALIGGGRHDLRLALVGKGITFDAGGLSIKTAEQMLRMKGDMAGAAAVLAAIEVIAARRLPLDVMAVVAASENMLSGSAQRPGDVVKSANGKMVEVVNTDAEGRLVLADALTYAIRRGATHLVDVATLTGAATTALGHGATLAVANDDELWAQAAQAAELGGDRAWRLPMYPDYEVLIESRIADLKNGFYGEAGAITAGMFLREFVEGRPWLHLDIAASAWNSNDNLVTIPRGPLGACTRLLIYLAQLMTGLD